MQNKIGFKNNSFKSENYAVAPMQEQANTTQNLDKKALIQALGWEKIQDLLQQYLSHQIAYEDVLCKELAEIRKHFF